MNKGLIVLTGILILGIAAFFLLKNQSSSPVSPKIQTESQSTSITKDQFSTPKKSAHYESNTPEHGATLAATPINVVIDFNFDLAKGSEIKIEMEGKDYGASETTIDANKLAMRRKMDPASPDGLYTVSYKTCWTDGSCHDGNFQFKIDKSKALEFEDLTGKKEITINLQNYSFSPPRVRVSKGTNITWINQDDVIHTVNTDSHPGHNYYPNQNSRDLAKGNTYAVTFAVPGIYLYHCTPHADTMHGQILVE